MELLASVELLAEDVLRDKGNDPRAALERLELPAPVDLLATVGLLAEDESFDEGDELQATLKRHELQATAELVALFELLADDETMNLLTKAMICSGVHRARGLH